MTQAPHRSRAAVEARYRDIRGAALAAAERIVVAQLAPIPVRLDLIGVAALAAFRNQWEGDPRRRYPWQWEEIAMRARLNEPGRFEVAVWSGNVLCGLSIGAIRSEFCRVDYIEGAPAPDHPLRGAVTAIVAGAAVAYATALGRREIRLLNPLPAVVPRYTALGFTLAMPKGATPYCWRKIT